MSKPGILSDSSLHSQGCRICKFKNLLKDLILQISSRPSHDCISDFEPLKVNAGKTLFYSRARSNDKIRQNHQKQPFHRSIHQPELPTKLINGYS